MGISMIQKGFFWFWNTHLKENYIRN